MSSEQKPSSSMLPSGNNAGPVRKSHWLRWSLLSLLALGIAYAVILRPLLNSGAEAAAAGGPGAGGMRGGARSMPVGVAQVRQTDLQLRQNALGTVVPLNAVTVKSRVDGQLRKVLFQEGRMVKAGEPLVEIDPRPFEVSKLQAEAQAAKDRALLENARLDLKRFQTLLEQDSISSQQVDTQTALVHQYEAAVKLDEAQIQSAALQLEYAHVLAPISGRAGLRLVDQGNIVRASDASGITVITQLQPISVVFSLPQDAVARVLSHFDAGEEMRVDAFARDGKTLLGTGKLVTVDNQVDLTTGTVKMRAEFTNENNALFPNQFVNVQLFVETVRGVTAAPTAAVQRGASGFYVFVANQDDTAALRQVETGIADGPLTVILKGLNPGERVVVDGVDKLRDGAPIEVANLAPSSAEAGKAAAPGKGERGQRRNREGGGGAPREQAPGGPEKTNSTQKP